MTTAEILAQFSLPQAPGEVHPLGDGLINDTFRVEPCYVLQSVNNHIFKDVDALQHNIQAVTGHLRKKLLEKGCQDIDRAVLHFYPLKDSDKTYFFDGEKYWRVMRFIDRSVTHNDVNPKTARQAGEKFGEFQALLADLPETLSETIPRFHDMELRLEQLRQAVAENPVGRLKEVQPLVDEILAEAPRMCLAEELHRQGKLPKRVCHCDTKVNNMLYDAATDSPLCVIDLDTVMPSYIFSDYGDFLRAAANAAPEDAADLSTVAFRPEIFEAFTEGYLSQARSFLTDVEIENLPFAVELFPYMQAVRFLTDYINGDTYYKIAYPEHNLVRARSQWDYFQKVGQAVPDMKAFLKKAMD